MRLQPYLRVDDVAFSATRDEVLARFGTPARMQRNPVALDELDYGRVVYRFQASGRLEEVTQRAPVLYVVDADTVHDVPFAGLAEFVRVHDEQAFRRAGFVVSPRYGLACVPAEPDWVTALAHHCIESWRALQAG